MGHKTDHYDAICIRFGINKSWLADRLGMSRQAFYRAEERGFYASEAKILEKAFRDMGKALIDFEVPESRLHPEHKMYARSRPPKMANGDD